MPISAALDERCYNHELREAASRCPVCRRYFCRECVTEHDDRVICAGCLKRMRADSSGASRAWRRIARPLGPVLGLLIAWLAFYCVGRALLAIPVAVHDGAVISERSK
jgi:hypothetical protein